MKLPEEYVRYLADNGLKEGGLTVEPGWFQLWPPDEVGKWNQDYHVEESAPGFLGFGSNGGGEMLAFDIEGHVVMIPFIGMSASDVRLVAGSWKEFTERIEIS
jgi:hypothetical protein